MVRDKIIQMDNGKSYYILEEVVYLGRKFLLSVECDVEKDTVNDKDFYVMELTFENSDLVIKQVHDDEIVGKVTEMLLNKAKYAVE